jgi:hypothetical protein
VPQRNKDGLDWPTIQVRYIAGESASALAREFGVTRQGIAKRAKKEGWWDHDRTTVAAATEAKSDPVTPEPGCPVTPPVAPVIVTKGKGKSPLDRYGLRTTENAELAVKLAMEGKTYAVIAPRLGMTPSALKQWRDDDPAFNTALQDAMAVYVGERTDDITKASQRGDARAAQWIVERHPLTRHELGSGRDGGGSPTIVIMNVPRSGEQLEQFQRTGCISSTQVIDAEVTEVN